MELHDFLAGIAVLIGLVGIVVVLLPGLLLQVGAIAVWAFEVSTVLGWIVFGMTAAIALVATVLKYVFPQRRLKQEGLPGWVLFIAVIVAIVGFFVVPVVGAPLGFILAIYVFERARRGPTRAWPSTKTALKAVLASTGIELAGGFLILLVFVAGAVLT